MHCPDDVSQILIVLSREADARRIVLGDQAIERIAELWPLSVKMQLPVASSHTLILLSFDPEAMCTVSGDQATERTSSLWPSKVVIH